MLNLRRAFSHGFDWSKVDGDELLTAFFAAGLEGAALMISPAAGGRGVCLKLFIGDDKEVEYATTPEELNELLGQVVDQLQPVGQDLRQIMAMTPPAGVSEANMTVAESVLANGHDPLKGQRKPIGS